MSETVDFNINGDSVSVLIEGGALAPGMSIANEALNAAVAEAQQAAEDATTNGAIAGAAAGTTAGTTAGAIAGAAAAPTAPVTARARTRTVTDWTAPGLYDATYDILRARTLPGYNGDDAVAFNAISAVFKDIQLNPDVLYLNCKTSLLLPLANPKLVFQGGGQAIPIMRDAALAGSSTMIVGNPTGAGCGSAVVEGAWFTQAGRIGWYSSNPEGTPLPGRLTGSESHIEVHGAQSASITVGGYGGVYLVSVFGGNDCKVNVASYGGMWDPLYTAVQESRAVVRLTRSATHGNGTCHQIINPMLVGGSVTARRNVTIGNKTVSVTRRVGPLDGILIESCEKPKVTGGFSGGFARSNIAIYPVASSFISDVMIESHDIDESNEYGLFAFRASAGITCPYTVMVSNCTFNGQLIGLRAISIDGTNGLHAVRNLRLTNNTYRAYLSGALLLTGVDGGLIKNERLAGYNCSANDTGAGGDATTSGIFVSGVTQNVATRECLFGGGINQDNETNAPDAFGVTPNGTQWGFIDQTTGQGNTYTMPRAINFGIAGGGVTLGGTLDGPA